MIWTSKDIVTAILATGAVSALLTNLFGGIRDWIATRIKQRKEASYMAMRLAVLLEAYVMACADFVQANDNSPHLADEEFPHWNVKLPDLPPYPDDTDGWRALNPSLADRCLQLPNTIHGAQATIRSVIEYSEERLENELRRHAAKVGLEAWQAAADLRKTYKLRGAELAWDAPGSLEGTMSSVNRADRDKRKDF